MGTKRAKKSSKQQPTLDVVDTGIYQELVIKGEDWKIPLRHEVIKLEQQRDIGDILAACLNGDNRPERAIEVLVSPAAAASLKIAMEDDRTRNATQRAWQLVQGYAANLRQSLAEGDAKTAALYSYRLGRAVERLAVVPHEPVALTGKRTRKSLDTGRHVRKRKAAERKSVLKQEAIEAVEKATAELIAEGRSLEHMRESVLRRAAKKIPSSRNPAKSITVEALRHRLKIT